jgi:hypothetical protein
MGGPDDTLAVWNGEEIAVVLATAIAATACQQQTPGREAVQELQLETSAMSVLVSDITVWAWPSV